MVKCFRSLKEVLNGIECFIPLRQSVENDELSSLSSLVLMPMYYRRAEKEWTKGELK